MSNSTQVPVSQAEWRKALADLPSEGKVPSFFFAHGSPMLISPPSTGRGGRFDAAVKSQGPQSPLAEFLKDFGPPLLEKYHPRAIVIFSAHWETSGNTLVTDYGDENLLLYDYYGFDPEFYEVKFKSKGDVATSDRIVELLKESGLSASKTSASEPRGRDGRGFNGPGLDHGVFIPFKVMFGDEIDVPIVEVSLDGSLDPGKNWALGKALTKMRSEGYLILSGGLTVHTFQDWHLWSEETATPEVRDLHYSLLNAVQAPAEDRKAAMEALMSHKGFRKAHPREEHFIPIYIAAGAGEEGQAKVMSGAYGAPTIAFGL